MLPSNWAGHPLARLKKTEEKKRLRRRLSSLSQVAVSRRNTKYDDLAVSAAKSQVEQGAVRTSLYYMDVAQDGASATASLSDIRCASRRMHMHANEYEIEAPSALQLSVCC